MADQSEGLLSAARRHWFSRSTTDEPVLLPGRLSWLRLLTLPLLLGVPHFSLGVPVTPLWLGLSLLSTVFVLLAGRFPISAAIAQLSLLSAIALGSDIESLPFKVVASFALFEAALTRPLRFAAIPGGLLAIGTIAITSLQAEQPSQLVYKIAFVALAPLLLGAYLRAQHMATRDRHAATVAAEARRRLAEREASLRERAAIARELHDIVAHHVASIALRSAVARDVLPGLDPAVRRVLDEIHGAATLTLTEMRRLVALLRVPATIDGRENTTLTSRVEMLDPAELLPEIELVLARVADLGLDLDLQVEGEVDQLDAGQAITVLRVVQESVTNVLRHAGAKATGSVNIVVDDRAVRVAIRDTGVGSAAVPGGRGFGLVGLGERLELLGGTLRAGPADVGWQVVAIFDRHRSDSPAAAAARRDEQPPPAEQRSKRRDWGAEKPVSDAARKPVIDSPAPVGRQVNR